MYAHRYKHGKQKTIMPNAVFEAAMQDAVNKGEDLERLAYITFVHYSGCRKSEGYERLVEDVTLTKELVVVDFHQRKKNGLQMPPNEIPREWYGVNEFLVPWIVKRQSKKAKATAKRLFYQRKTGEFRQTSPTPKFPQGSRVEIKKHVFRVEKAVWLFPHISSTTAWQIYKTVYGEKYYPHYDRLWRLSKAAQTADNMGDMITAVRRVSGLKTLSAMESYFGDDEAVGKKAMHTLPGDNENE